MAENIGIRDLRGKIQISCDIFKSAGYGAIEIIKVEEEPPYVYIRIYDCIECWLGRKAEKPFSQFIRGTIAGFGSEVFKRRMFAKETMCIARGDPYCEFEVTPEETRG